MHLFNSRNNTNCHSRTLHRYEKIWQPKPQKMTNLSKTYVSSWLGNMLYFF